MKLMNQKELAERWCVAEATLERWRSIGAGPPYLKLVSQVRYRLSDVEASTRQPGPSNRRCLAPGGPCGR